MVAMNVRQRTVVGPLLAQRGRCTRVVGHRESVERRPSRLSLGNYPTLQQCHGIKWRIRVEET